MPKEIVFNRKFVSHAR